MSNIEQFIKGLQILLKYGANDMGMEHGGAEIYGVTRDKVPDEVHNQLVELNFMWDEPTQHYWFMD